MDNLFLLRSAFLAIPLQGEAKKAYAELQNALSEFDSVLLFQSLESAHLTLQFWERVMEIEHGQIIHQAQRIAAASEPFTLKVEGASTFGEKGNDRVLFLGVPFNENLARLKKRFPWPSPQPFSPHITIARIRHPQRFAVVKKKIMKLIGDASFIINVDRLRLYAEIEGVKQTAIRDFAFSSV